MRPSARS